MASIQERVRNDGSKHYVVKWKDSRTGKYHSKGGFQTKRAAENWAAIELEPKRRRGITYDPSAGRLLFRNAAQVWLASRHDLKETTRAAYADALAPTPTTGTTAKRHQRLADLRIDAVFGGYRLDAITREYISDWVARMVRAGKKPSTIRNAYFLVRMVLGQAVVDGRLDTNPADYVKLPTEHSLGTTRLLDDPAQILTAAQVSALVAATPWPYNVLVNLAAWAGLRAAELAGLQVGDVDLVGPGSVRVERAVARIGSDLVYVPTKTRGSRRQVPLPPTTAALLQEYLAEHPHRPDSPSAPLFPAVALRASRPTGVPTKSPGSASAALRQATALAGMSATDAAERLVLDWEQPLRHATFYKAVYRPAVLRAALSPELKFHSLRHTYASLCVAAGIPPEKLSRRMGHAKIGTTLGIYVHLLPDDDASDDMAALGALAAPTYGNVIPLHG